MANDNHLAQIHRGRDHFEQWRTEEQPREIDLVKAPLAGKDFTGWNLSQVNFNYANLSGANFTHANLSSASLTGADLSGANFTSANCRGAGLSNARLDGSTWIGTDLDAAALYFDTNHECELKLVKCTLRSANLQASMLNGWNFDHCTMDKVQAESAQLQGASLSGSSFKAALLNRARLNDADCKNTDFRNARLENASLCGANIADADFLEATIAHVDFRDARNAHLALNLERTIFPEEPHLRPQWFDTVTRRWIDKNCDWESLARLGRLQIFGVSYSLLLYLVTVFYVVGQFNQQVEIARHWAASQSTYGNVAEKAIAEQIQQRLVPFTVGWQSFGFLASTLTLVVASMIFAVFCPPEVKEFSSTQWLYAHKRSLVHYWPLCWRRPWIRVLCGSLYVLGGVPFLFLSVWKILEAANYGWSNLRDLT